MDKAQLFGIYLTASKYQTQIANADDEDTEWFGNVSSVSLTRVSGKDTKGQKFCIGWDYVQLILRQLEDLTDEEILQIRIMHYSDCYPNMIEGWQMEQLRKEDLRWFHEYRIIPALNSNFNCYGMSNCKPLFIRWFYDYLRSIGVDVDGLIDQGYAVRKEAGK